MSFLVNYFCNFNISLTLISSKLIYICTQITTKKLYIMQNIDKKVTLILNLNKKLKRIDFFIEQNYKNNFMKEEIGKAHSKSLLLYRVLDNLNYINY